MNAKNKKIRSRLSVIFIVVGLMLAVGAVAGIIFRDKFVTFSGSLMMDIENTDKPKFVFDTAEFPDWVTVGNVWSAASDTEEGTPVASISISQCPAGSRCGDLVEKCRAGDNCDELERYTVEGCMVHFYYWGQPVEPSVAVADELKQWSGFGTAATEIDVKTLTMRTSEGDKNYQFHKYGTNSKDASYKRGSAFGFVPLDTGHIEVRSICKQADQLDETLPVLDAVSLEV